MKKGGIVILNEYIDSLRKLSREELGTMMMAVLDNAAGEEPNLDGASLMVEVLYPIFQASVDRMRETSEQKSEAGKQGGRPKKNSAFENKKAVLSKNEKPEPNHTEPNQTNISPSGDARARENRFTQPTVEEVAEYAREKGITVDADRFVDFYASKGWMVGKNKMIDWRAAVRNWSNRNKAEKPPDKPAASYEAQLAGVDYAKLLYKPEEVASG